MDWNWKLGTICVLTVESSTQRDKPLQTRQHEQMSWIWTQEGNPWCSRMWFAIVWSGCMGVWLYVCLLIDLLFVAYEWMRQGRCVWACLYVCTAVLYVKSILKDLKKMILLSVNSIYEIQLFCKCQQRILQCKPSKCKEANLMKYQIVTAFTA